MRAALISEAGEASDPLAALLRSAMLPPSTVTAAPAKKPRRLMRSVAIETVEPQSDADIARQRVGNFRLHRLYRNARGFDAWPPLRIGGGFSEIGRRSIHGFDGCGEQAIQFGAMRSGCRSGERSFHRLGGAEIEHEIALRTPAAPRFRRAGLRGRRVGSEHGQQLDVVHELEAGHEIG